MDAIVELDRRSAAGIDVRLLWSPSTNAVAVFVRNKHESEKFVVSVGPNEALDAFRHPYAYRNRRPTAQR